MFFLHARFPLRLDCESWEGAPSVDFLAGFVAIWDEELGELASVVALISAKVKLNSCLACMPDVLRKHHALRSKSVVQFQVLRAVGRR